MTGKFKVDDWLKIVQVESGHKFKLEEEVYVTKVCKNGYMVTNGRQDWMVEEEEVELADDIAGD